jgi:predicted RNA-binding Zn ribbon-like protein
MSDTPAAPRAEFTFFAAHAALDLPATLTGRLKTATRELLVQPEDLRRWLVAAGRVDTAPPVGSADLETARALRESIYVLALAAIGGKKFPAGARRILNRIAAGTTAVPQLTPGGGVSTAGSARAALAGIARDAVGLFGSAAVRRIRQCEAETCARLFLDTSRSGERRWCSMAGCGNKAKVAQFRRRQR